MCWLSCTNPGIAPVLMGMRCVGSLCVLMCYLEHYGKHFMIMEQIWC